MKSMDVCPQEKRPMSTMPSTTPPRKSMPSKYTKHPFLFSKIEIDMWKVSSDSEEVIVPAILERW